MMAIKNKLILITLSSAFLISCNDKNIADIYQGSSDMTANLSVNWNDAANKCSSILTKDFLPDNTNFCNEIWWDMSAGANQTKEQYVKGDLSLFAQSQAVDLLIDSYNRTSTADYLTKAKAILASVYVANSNSYADSSSYASSAFMGITLLRMYSASKDQTYLKAAKELYTNIAAAATSKNVKAADLGIADPGAIGVPVSDASLNNRSILSNGASIILAVKLYTLTNEQSYLAFALKVYSFAEQNLFEGSGQTYDSAIMNDLGTSVLSQDKASYSGNQGVMIGACLALYNASKDDNTKAQYLKYANLFANYQAKGSYSSVRQIIYKQYPVFMPDYTSLPGAVNRSLMLYRGIFFRYLRDLIEIPNNDNATTLNLCLTNNVESLWQYGQEKESCLWGTRWYEAPYTGEYVSTTDVTDPYISKKVVSLEAEIAGATLIEMKAEMSQNKN